MPNGLWQYVQTDAQLHPTTAADKYSVFLACSGDLDDMNGADWADWDAYCAQAEKVFQTTIDKLQLYWYSDQSGVVQLIAAEVALDVQAHTQPKRVVQNYQVDVSTGLITRVGLIFKSTLSFYAEPPISRVPDAA